MARIGRLPILDRYILQELSRPFLLTVGGFFVFSAGNILFQQAQYIVGKNIPLMLLVKMVVLQMPAMLLLAAPVGMLFATMTGLGKLAADNEIATLRTSGVSFTRILLPVFAAGALMSVLTFFNNEVIAPRATHESLNIVRRVMLRQSIPLVTPNVFIRGPENWMFYVGQADYRHNRLANVMAFQQRNGRYPTVYIAPSAEYNDADWTLHHGVIHEYGADGRQIRETAFDTLTLHVVVDPEVFFSGTRTPWEMNARELAKQLSAFEKSGIDVRSQEVDLQFKLSLPLAALISAMIGAPLSVRFPRSGKAAGVALALLLVLVYYGLLVVCMQLGKTEVLPPVWAAWLPNLIMGGVGLGLLWAEDH